jgi:inosine-uridine nucleoside N-ribohydrolase
MTPRPVIVDCDNALGIPGCDVDDGLALLFLLAMPHVEIRAVTTCFGNAPLGLVLHATRRLLRDGGPPVLAGASRPGAPDSEAARFLVDATAREPGRLTILALGPLSNLAAAARLDPGFPGRCAAVIALGGTLGPAPRLGWRRLRELNFAADPAAASLLLARRDVAVTVVPTTGCLGLQIGTADIGGLDRALHGPLRRWLACLRWGRGLAEFVAWDLVAALALTHPHWVRDEAAIVGLGTGGVLSATSGGHHRLVGGLSDAAAAKAAIMQALAAPPR